MRSRPKRRNPPYDVFQLIDLDVWGNDRDGYDVNDQSSTDQYYFLQRDWTDKQIVQSLKDQGLIKKTVRYSSVGIDGEWDYELYFEHRGRPEFNLRYVDVSPDEFGETDADTERIQDQYGKWVRPMVSKQLKKFTRHPPFEQLRLRLRKKRKRR
jgi:hypothetical protein